MKNHFGKIIIVAIVALVAVIGGAVWYAGEADKATNEGITLTEHVKGNPEAAVVLRKYSDFQCPACAQAAPVVDDLLDLYGDDVRFEYHHFPLIAIHPLALPAARAAEAAGQQGQFFAMHDLLFENQRSWLQAANPSAIFITYAEELGLDVAMFKRQMGASAIDTHVRTQYEAAQALGFTGTPTFTLNGERMTFETYDDFIDQIVAAIEGQ